MLNFFAWKELPDEKNQLVWVHDNQKKKYHDYSIRSHLLI